MGKRCPTIFPTSGITPMRERLDFASEADFVLMMLRCPHDIGRRAWMEAKLGDPLEPQEVRARCCIRCGSVFLFGGPGFPPDDGGPP